MNLDKIHASDYEKEIVEGAYYVRLVYGNAQDNYLLNWIAAWDSNNVVCATSKASYQPAHAHSLIRAFACRLNILWVLSYWLNIVWSF